MNEFCYLNFKTDYNNFERKNQGGSKYYMTKYFQGIKTINRTISLCFYFSDWCPMFPIIQTYTEDTAKF